MKSTRWLIDIAVLALFGCGESSQVVALSVTDAPDTPFKLATFKRDDGAGRGHWRAIATSLV